MTLFWQILFPSFFSFNRKNIIFFYFLRIDSAFLIENEVGILSISDNSFIKFNLKLLDNFEFLIFISFKIIFLSEK